MKFFAIYNTTIAIDDIAFGRSGVDEATLPNLAPVANAGRDQVTRDIDGDGDVDIDDLYIVAHAFGSVPGDANWDARADLNKDNSVDIMDLIIVARNFGRGV